MHWKAALGFVNILWELSQNWLFSWSQAFQESNILKRGPLSLSLAVVTYAWHLSFWAHNFSSQYSDVGKGWLHADHFGSLVVLHLAGNTCPRQFVKRLLKSNIRGYLQVRPLVARACKTLEDVCMRLPKNLVRHTTLLKVGPRQLLWQLGTKRAIFCDYFTIIVDAHVRLILTITLKRRYSLFKSKYLKSQGMNCKPVPKLCVPY